MKKLTIREVGPRDGFQNVRAQIPTDTKLAIIDQIIQTGVKHIQITSFVNPKAIPQMSDSLIIAEECINRYGSRGLELSALIPNRKGADRATSAGLTNLTYVTSVTESHNMANVKKTRAESIKEFAEIIEAYPDVHFSWDLSMAFGCIFEGNVAYHTLADMIEAGTKIGVKDFNLCDTNGTANPSIIRDRITRLLNNYPDCHFRVHIHDTRNMGMVNTLAAIECGIDDVESTLGGLGGCPFSPGASGNTATEDLAFMLQEMGYDLDVDVEKLISAGKYELEQIPEGNFSGHLIRITDECLTQS